MFEVPASKRSLKQNRFEFKVGGKKYDIPKLKFAPVKALEHFENERNLSALIASADTDAAREAIRSMDGDQLEAFTNAWVEDSGVDLGESEASTDS